MSSGGSLMSPHPPLPPLPPMSASMAPSVTPATLGLADSLNGSMRTPRGEVGSRAPWERGWGGERGGVPGAVNGAAPLEPPDVADGAGGLADGFEDAALMRHLASLLRDEPDIAPGRLGF